MNLLMINIANRESVTSQVYYGGEHAHRATTVNPHLVVGTTRGSVKAVPDFWEYGV